MWDFEDKIGDYDDLYDEEDNKNDSEGVDSETEARLYSSIYYQDMLHNDNTKNEVESIAGPSTVKSNKTTRNKKKTNEILNSSSNYAMNKLTKFVSIVSDKHSLPEEIDLISSDSDVKMIKKTSKKTKKKCKMKKEIVDNQSSDSDIFIQNDDSPTDISININSVFAKKNIQSWFCNDETRKRKEKCSIDSRKRKNDFSTAVEKMRKFYDSISSDEETNLVDKCKGNWRIDDVDRFGWIESKRRFYGGGFGFKNRIKCRNCQQFGHVENRCPDPKRISHCHLCGGENHKADDCLYIICTRCTEMGHDSNFCCVSKSQISKKCKRCGNTGHTQANCPDVWRRYYLTTSEGPIVKGSGDRNSRVFCFNCAKEGHFGHKCNRRFMNPSCRPANPFIISYSDSQEGTHDDEARRKMIDESNEWWKGRNERKNDDKKTKKRKKKNYERRRDVKRHKTNDKTRNDVQIQKSKKKEKPKNEIFETDFVRLAINNLRKKIKKREEKKKKIKEPNLTLIKQKNNKKRNKN